MHEAVPLERLQAVADMAPKPEPRGTPGANGQRTEWSRLLVAKYLEHHRWPYRLKDKPTADGRDVYLVECPFDREHGQHTEVSVMQDRASGRPSFKCMHHGCTGKGWQDFKAAVGPPLSEHYDPPLKPRQEARREQAPRVHAPDEEPQERFPVLTSAELDATEDDIEYLVDGMLVRGQPGGVFGGKKTLKTNVLIDLTLSLAQVARDNFGNESGGLFLGQFKVLKPCRVGLLSGESGRATIAETARRIARSKRWPLRDFEGIAWGFNLPRLGDENDLDALREFIDKHRLDVLTIDPAYLAMKIDPNDAGNIFAMGDKLIGLSQIAQEFNCTPLICHHTKKNPANAFEPPELEDIAWSGFQEWVRQWILAGRREAYDPEVGGSHKLWLNYGGSAGHSGLWAVDIEEGTRQDQGGRRWEVQIIKASQARAQAAEQQAEVVDKRKEAKEQAALRRDRERLLGRLRRYPDGETESKLRGSLAGGRFHVIIESLIDDELAEKCEVYKPPRKTPYQGYRPASKSNRSNGISPGAPGGVDQGAGETPPKGGSPVSHCSPPRSDVSPDGLGEGDDDEG